MPSPFSYAAFADACDKLVAEDVRGPARMENGDIDVRAHLCCWQWRDHAVHKGNGYLMKRCRRRACDTKLAEIEELDDTTPEFQEESADPAEAKDSAHRSFRTLVVNWHILFSRTYLVPQLGFTVHDEERGSSVSLEDIIASRVISPPSPPPQTTDLLHHLPLPITSSDQPFPLLLQMEHPTTGESIWAIHPCQSREMVDEVVAMEREDVGLDVGWLEAWITVCTSLVDLR